ncbi:MAG: hypothetical protein WC783_03370 [Candidatus Paceibacterota bacterium]|jgi:hypothetical protein
MTNDLDSLLAEAEDKSTPKKKANAIPEYNKAGVALIVDEIIALEKEITSKKTTKEEKLANLYTEIVPFRATTIQTTKTYSSSVRIKGMTGEILITFKNAYSKIAKSAEKSLRAVFGTNYESFFKKDFEIKVKDAMKSDKAINELIEMIGKENFLKYFDVESTIKPTSKFHEEKMFDLTEVEKENIAEIVKPYAPSCKVELPKKAE